MSQAMDEPRILAVTRSSSRGIASERPARRLWTAVNPASAVTAVVISATTIGVLICTSHAMSHWFVVPLFLCGATIGVDLVDWARGKLDLFSPAGVLGAVGFHFFFIAPLLHVYWDYWPIVPDAPGDWRPWLGGMAILNWIGLLAYTVIVRAQPRKGCLVQSSHWTIDTKSFLVVWLFLLAVSAATQFLVYRSFGGLLGYMFASVDSGEAFSGMGFALAIGESFPILLAIGVTFLAARANYVPSIVVVIVCLVLLFVIQMVFGGFRGSRSNTIWALFWMVGLVHWCLRPISRRLTYVGMVFLLGFMVVYSYYKSYGPDAVAVIGDEEARAESARYQGQPFKGVLLHDFARSDMHALLLYRFVTDEPAFALGKTYAGAAALALPGAILEDKPPTKAKVGTEVLYGPGSYVPGSFRSSRLYGLVGEGMLNFGPAAVPLALALLGLLVAAASRWIGRLNRRDARMLIAPFVTLLCFFVLLNDSDNILFVMMKNLTMPALLLAVSTRFRSSSAYA